MLPQSQARKKKNSSKVNLIISAVFHGLVLGALLYFAAKKGYLGKEIQKITVTMVKTEKPKEPEKAPPPPPKIDQAKLEPAKLEQPKMEEARVAPPPSEAPTVAPPAAVLPTFELDEGGRQVDSTSDPVQIYKGYVEYAFRSKWQRPEDMADDNYVAEVAVDVDSQGQVSNPVWQKGSGNKRWDDSVKEVFNEVTSLDKPPPTNFPPHITIRFDVQQEDADTLGE